MRTRDSDPKKPAPTPITKRHFMPWPLQAALLALLAALGIAMMVE